MIEIWKEIRETKNYSISDLGRFKNNKTGKIHKIQNPSWGKYYTVKFFVNGKRISRSIHQLVALAFIPNIENKKCVNHRFGDKKDNRAASLEWATYSENNQHAYDTGLKKYRPLHNLGKFGKDHNRSKRVYKYSQDVVLISEYGSVSEASRMTGVCLTDISKSAKRQMFQAGGFVWSYVLLDKESFPIKPKFLPFNKKKKLV